MLLLLVTQAQAERVLAAVRALTPVTKALLARGIAPERLCIEITENAVLEEVDHAIATLEALRGLGVCLAIDDFGTGYSSLAYLTSLPVDELKIDRSFVEQLDETDDRSRTVVAATITLGHQLGLEITAEGVETDQQQQVLTDLGCDHVQGFLRSRPVSAEVVEAMIAEQAALS